MKSRLIDDTSLDCRLPAAAHVPVSPVRSDAFTLYKCVSLNSVSVEFDLSFLVAEIMQCLLSCKTICHDLVGNSWSQLQHMFLSLIPGGSPIVLDSAGC